MKRCFLNERLKNIFLKNRDMRFIKMTGGLGNQMFIYAFYMRMKKHYSNTRIDLSDMVHYKAHNGYEMHRVFNLPPIEFRINQPLKKVIEFLFFKTMMRMRFPYMYAGEITWNPNIGKQPAVYANCLITSTP